eukprot:4996822-Pyramimonas_sp.AAC.1
MRLSRRLTVTACRMRSERPARESRDSKIMRACDSATFAEETHTKRRRIATRAPARISRRAQRWRHGAFRRRDMLGACAAGQTPNRIPRRAQPWPRKWPPTQSLIVHKRA